MYNVIKIFKHLCEMNSADESAKGHQVGIIRVHSNPCYHKTSLSTIIVKYK